MNFRKSTERLKFSNRIQYRVNEEPTGRSLARIEKTTTEHMLLFIKTIHENSLNINTRQFGKYLKWLISCDFF